MAVSMRQRLQPDFVCVVFLIAGTALGQANTSDRVEVQTVCDILLDQGKFNGKAVAVLGRFIATDEGAWLTEDDCGREVEAQRVPVHLFVWIEQGGIPSNTPGTPVLDQDSLKLKLAQAAKTTRLGKRVEFRCTISARDGKPKCGWPEVQDRWAIAYGRVETQGDRGYGFGHLNGAPAQVVVQGQLIFIEEKTQDAKGLQRK
jgi:hypothetical protein